MKRPLLILSSAEVARLLDAVSGQSATSLRSRALLLTLQRCGLRVGEAARLRESDINISEGILRITSSKRYRSRSRLVGLEPTTAAHLAAWIERRAKLGIQAAPLFCALSGRPIGANAIRAWLRRLTAKAGVGIGGRVVPHSLRHSFAAHLITHGARIDEVASALGHQSIRTTAIYLGSISATSALDAVRRTQW